MKDLAGDLLPAGVATRLGTTRLRHTGAILATAWAPDGKLLASAGMDELIRLWDPATGKEVRQMKGVVAFTALAFFNDGKTLISADWLGSIRLWDVESGREIRRFGSNKDKVTCLALSPDNRTLFSAGSERIVRQWLVAAGIELKQFPVQKGNILALAVTPDGKEVRIATDGVAVVFDTSTGLESRRFAIERLFPNVPAAFSKDGKVLACTRAVGANVNLYDADNGKLLRAFDGVTVHLYDDRGNRTSTVGRMSMRPYALDFSANGKFLAMALGGGGVRIFGVVSGHEMRAFENPGATRGAIAFAPDGQTLAVTGGEQALRLWHVADGRETLPLPGHGSAVHSLCFSRDGTLLFTTSSDKTVRVWDRATGKEIAHFEGKFGNPSQLSVGAGPRSFFTVSLDGASEWTVIDKKISPVSKWDSWKSLRNLAASPDGKLVAVAGADPAIVLLDAVSRKTLIKLGELKEAAPGKPMFRTIRMVFSPDGKLLAVTSNAPNYQVQVWNTATGRLVQQFGKAGSAARIAFSPDSKLLAVSGETDIKIYEIASGQERQQVSQAIGVRALAYSPDGRYVLAGLFRGGVQCYEVATGFPTGQSVDAVGEVRVLAIAPDCMTWASAGVDTSVVLWSKPPWHTSIRAIAPPRLEPAEVETLWKTLAQTEGVRAHQAVWALASAHEQSVPYLKNKLKPADPFHFKRVTQYISDLDSDNFKIRQQAMFELRQLGDEVELSLRAALSKTTSLESRRRLEEILASVKVMSPQKLQMLRALETLEHAATDEARAVLAVLAEGGAGHWLTDYARQALGRLQSRKTRP